MYGVLVFTIADNHCSLEIYVNTNGQTGVHAQDTGGLVPQCPIAGNANGSQRPHSELTMCIRSSINQSINQKHL